ncbi:transmembrane reductase CYB561D2-like [Sitodiplosis mosellana]|uniref:transmembrane reductase CYB561D2-like n=1 Tax=Sitodiplosis mosellana TaxID=263140 RepID=UPI00244530CB|nr:transmembrane reductase CYB561D2-like [Sitodiplosis mosellana]
MKIQMEIESNKVEKVAAQSDWQVIETYFNVLNHIISSIAAVYMSFLCYSTGYKPISYHSWLCTIGYQLLMTQAILALYSENVWSKQHTRQTQKTIHWVLQAVGSSTAILGIIIQYIDRSLNSKPHFSSTHSIIGLIAAIFTLIGMFNGISALWSIKLKNYVRPVYSKLAHNLHGTVAYSLGMTALSYGYDQDYMQAYSREDIRMWLQVLLFFSSNLTLIGASRAALNHYRNAKNYKKTQNESMEPVK